jgi:hypothetical protein
VATVRNRGLKTTAKYQVPWEFARTC